PELTVSVDDITADNVINAVESGAATIAVTGTITTEAGAATSVTVTVNGVDYPATVDAESGTWTVDVATSDLVAGTTVSVSASATDAAGNATTAGATHTYGVDTTAPELTVSVEDVPTYELITPVESVARTMPETGTITTEAGAATSVTVTVNGVDYAATVDAATCTCAVDVAPRSFPTRRSSDLSASATDAAGNATTAGATHTYGVDTTAPELTVSVDDITADNVINAVESGAATIAVTGTITTEAGAATSVTVTVNGVDYAATVDAATGTWTVDVATSDLVAGTEVSVSASATDAAGNATTAGATHTYGVDTT